jgi:hypothetical protein
MSLIFHLLYGEPINIIPIALQEEETQNGYPSRTSHKMQQVR